MLRTRGDRITGCAMLRADSRLQRPRSDVSVVAFSTRCSVRTQTEYVYFAVHSRVQILVGIAPWILGQPLNIAARFPVCWYRRACGLHDESLQSLFARRVTVIIEAIKFQSLQQA